MTVDIYETINNNIYNFPKKLPYITISSKGISNGLSTIINDGADFGPDTYLNTTSKNRIGPPYTQTSGIQEAINYSLNQFTNTGLMPTIFLLTGVFVVDDRTTIWINNNTISPTGLNIIGAGLSQVNSIIVKKNYLSSPIISFTNTHDSTTGYGAVQMRFENFAIQYTGSPSNATSGVTLANLSIPETGGTNSVFKNLTVIGPSGYNVQLPNNVCLDLSGHEDALVEGLTIFNVNSAPTVFTSQVTPAFKMHTPGGNINIIRSTFSGMDLETTMCSVTESTIGASETAATGVIIRPSYGGFRNIFNFDGCYWNGGNPTLITIAPMSNGNVDTSGTLVNITNSLLAQLPSGNGSYMIEPNANIPVLWDFNNTSIINNDTSYNLYLFNPNITVNNYFKNLYSDMNKVNGVILPTENITKGLTGGTVIMKFLEYTEYHKKLLIIFNNYENNTPTNQTINFPLPFGSFTGILFNYFPFNIQPNIYGIEISSPNNTTQYSGIIIVEGY